MRKGSTMDLASMVRWFNGSACDSKPDGCEALQLSDGWPRRCVGRLMIQATASNYAFKYFVPVNFYCGITGACSVGPDTLAVIGLDETQP